MLTREIVYRKQKNNYKLCSSDIIFYHQLSIHQKINLRYYYLQKYSYLSFYYLSFYKRRKSKLCTYVLIISSTIFNKHLSIIE